MPKPMKKNLTVKQRAKLCNLLADHLETDDRPLVMTFWFTYRTKGDNGNYTDAEDYRDVVKDDKEILKCNMPCCVGGRIPLIPQYKDWANKFYSRKRFDFMDMTYRILGTTNAKSANLAYEDASAYSDLDAKWDNLFGGGEPDKPKIMARRLRKYADKLLDGREA